MSAGRRVSRVGIGLVALGVVWLGAGAVRAADPQAARPPDPAVAPAAAAVGAVTFARDIAPILQRSCQNCHRPGQVAPMSLLTYEEARPWARAMKLRTGLRDKAGAM